VAFRLNETNVVHDTIDGEVLAIRSDTGAYYSMQGPSATAWCGLISGGDPQRVAARVAEHHGAESSAVAEAMEAFGAHLVAEALLVEADALEGDGVGAAASSGEPDLPAETRGQAWEPLHFEKYSDMQDLLLFDPIHEVQPAGWPAVARPDDS
jgi:hypothetical protein